ncbi:hypothetical protein P691DRAFT_798361 [Macrolepiota fuliginosa MF-IS2]|uniref:Myb-like domain-containing protein n=1 Tax=Macrolepiota fuliginosa MF-IS2 TaxID=1400762 RepID=A0A9P5XQX5_9AGAR|nr:hypothetical protein P691DRAFT_798361 [Macrolepiota fuliginosa MF-IS2]
MSSRVQKGSTVFRPVARTRSRAPTATPVQTSLVPLDLSTIPEATLPPPAAPAPVLPQPIPSTAAPSREPPKQAPPPHSEPIFIVPQPPQNVIQEPPILARGISIPPPTVVHAPHVLFNTSNLPPTLINIGRSMTEPINAISMPTRQESRPPMILPHSYQIPSPGLPIMPPGPSQQSTVIFPPPAPVPTEVANTLVPISTPQNFQHISAFNSVQGQLQDDAGEKTKRKRKASKTHSDGETEDGPSTRKPKSRSTTPRQRRSRGPSLPPYDPSADPGEDIDPTVVTMAALCSDTGQGRVSSKAAEILSNHVAWKARNRERRARMRAIMEAKKYGLSADEETGQSDRPPNSAAESENRNGNGTHSLAGPSTSRADEETGIDYSQQLETSRYNVQVRIGPNGETIIDEESLVVDRAENEDTSNYTHIVESDHTKFVNSGTYGKRYRGSRWSAEETELFYNALAQYGENYELIAYVLPGRDRKSCKNKFKAEDKKNHARINYCLNNRIPVDMKTLERMTGKDFSGPVPEIRAPPPPPVVQLEQAQEENIEDSSAAAVPAKSVKKRSRSRTAGMEDGVVIIGNVGDVPS